MSHFKGHFEGAKTFLTLSIVPSAARENLGVKKVEKNYVPQFLKQRDINSYNDGKKNNLIVFLNIKVFNTYFTL
jgi:hypothetical protein